MYDWPVIKNIDDVLPHIDSTFIVKEKFGVVYINYTHASPDVFPPITDLSSKVRRECRGIAFCHTTGKILSRPFHKFFNYEEREEEDWSLDKPHVILEKLDGSMLRPIPYEDGTVRWATKAGVTDVGQMAETFVARNPQYQDFAKRCIQFGVTPIFEFCSRGNRVVLDYPQPTMVLLALRNNQNGHYLPFDIMGKEKEIPVVQESTVSVLEARGLEDSEGIVVRYSDGHMFKQKSEWYVKCHRGKELAANKRKAVGLILDDALDDVLPLVDEATRRELNKLWTDVWKGLEDTAKEYDEGYAEMRQNFETKKDFAVSPLAEKLKPLFKAYVFKAWDNKYKDPQDFLQERLKKSLTNETRFQQVLKQMEVDIE